MGVIRNGVLLEDRSGGGQAAFRSGKGSTPQIAGTELRDKAEAMRLYAKQANDIELETAAAEIKLRAT